MSRPLPLPSIAVVTSVSRLDVLQQRLAQSACLQRGGLPWSAYFNSTSAAAAFNPALQAQAAQGADWLVWVHQDVHFPPGWEDLFRHALRDACAQWPTLAVAGVYGVQGVGAQSVRAGHVLDRGHLLREPAPLPCLVDSLDELLVAVRVDSGLRMDPAMGFDFYATDLVLQAQEAGMCAAALDAFCEHWSDTPPQGVMPAGLIERIKNNAQAFEHKWSHRLPVKTPCFEIHQPGDVAAFVDSIATAAP
ncbi:MAG: hypothetical protein RSC66_05915 [Comamonas sp.]